MSHEGPALKKAKTTESDPDEFLCRLNNTLTIDAIAEQRQRRHAAEFLDAVSRLAMGQVTHESCRKHREQRNVVLEGAFICVCCQSDSNYHWEDMSGIDWGRMDKMSTLVAVRILGGMYVSQLTASRFNRVLTASTTGTYWINNLCQECAERVKTVYSIVKCYKEQFAAYVFPELIVWLVEDLCDIVVGYGTLSGTRECIYCVQI